MRFEWLDWRREVVRLRLGRSPRYGEATPKTGEREVDVSPNPSIFAAFDRRRRIDPDRAPGLRVHGLARPLSQECKGGVSLLVALLWLSLLDFPRFVGR